MIPEKKIAIDNTINTLVYEYLANIEDDKKNFLKNVLLSELEPYLNDSKLLESNIETIEQAFEQVVIWTINSYIKLLKTKLPEEFYADIIKTVINACYKAILICIEANFNEKDTLYVMENESHISLLLGITILKDDEMIDNKLFKDSINLLDQYIEPEINYHLD